MSLSAWHVRGGMLDERDGGILMAGRKFRNIFTHLGFWFVRGEINFVWEVALDDNLDVFRFYDIFFPCKLLLTWAKLDINSFYVPLLAVGIDGN